MAKSRVKGIVVSIGGDTTGLDKALSNTNKQIRDTQSQLKDVERLLKLDPKNTELLAQNPAATVKHMNADEFTGYLIHSIRTGNPDPFREECETADALLVDDVQYFSGKERTQEEFFRFLKTRFSANRLTVLTIDCSFEAAKSIENELRSSFPGIVWATADEPDYEVRAGIVRAKAAELELQLSGKEIDLIAKDIPGGLRNIHGVLNRISLYHSFPEAFPDAPSISEIIRDASLN